MKKISLLTAVLLLTNCLFFSVKAAESNDVAEAKRKLNVVLNAFENDTPFGEENPYKPVLADSNALYDRVNGVLSSPTATVEDCLQAQEEIFDYEYYQKYIEYGYANETYLNALNESNNFGFYTEAEWSDFQEKITGLKAALDAYSAAGQANVTLTERGNLTEAFHGLLRVYNRMTNRDALIGDVNLDGKVNIKDITELQRYLADYVTLNGAQRMRAAVSGMRFDESISIEDVTAIQRYLAEYTSEIVITGNRFPVFISEIRHDGFRSDSFLEERMLNFAICPRYAQEHSVEIYPGFYSPHEFIAVLSKTPDFYDAVIPFPKH